MSVDSPARLDVAQREALTYCIDNQSNVKDGDGGMRVEHDTSVYPVCVMVGCQLLRRMPGQGRGKK